MPSYRLMLALLLAGAAAAQEVRTEHQRPLDQDGKLWEVKPALRRQLQLFPDTKGFEAARLYQGDDSTWVLEVSYQSGPWLSHRRSPLSAAGVDSLRRDLAARLLRSGPGSRLDQSARGSLVTSQMLLSLVFYGPAVPRILGISGSRPVVGCYLLTNAAAFYLPYRVTRRLSVTPTHGQLTRYGSLRGAYAGALLSDMILADGGNDRTALGGAVAGSVASAVAGYCSVGRRGYTQGQAELLQAMADFGFLAGMGVAYTSGLYSDDATRRAGHAMVLASGRGVSGVRL